VGGVDILNAVSAREQEVQVPRITEPTVAEHREKQRRALLDAAQALLTEGGAAAVTAGAVAARTGLARNSIYVYFPTMDSLVAATIEQLFPPWLDAVKQAMASAQTPRDKILAYVRSNLEQAASGGHQWLVALARGPMPAAARERIMELHQPLREPLDAALKELASPQPTMDGVIIQAIVDAGTRMIDEGEPASTVIAHCVRAVDRCLS
jgi:AcrR family transcriptional regulator